MTQYVGCDHARTLLEGLVDGELSMPEQLAVESHLRWCDTCARRVEDMRIIGASLRVNSAVRPVSDADNGTLSVLTDGLLVRVGAERAQSFPSRVREMFVDRRLLWPALGATAAVLLCVSAAFSVLHMSVSHDPESLAAMISALGSPGTELRPLRPADNGITIPRLSEDEAQRAGDTLELMPEEDAIFTFRTTVGRDGSIANYERLGSDETPSTDRKTVARAAAQELAVLNAVRHTRFVPAQTPLGQAVAVDMVWVIAKTTAIMGPPEPLRRRTVSDAQVKETVKPPAQPASPPVSSQPAAPPLRPSATA
jgi:hypothetical protein